MSDNLDNLLGDIYSSKSQSQGVKELAILINNLSQLLLKAISQLEARVLKLEQQSGRGGPAPRAASPVAAPAPKAASPFSAPAAPVRTPPPLQKPAATASTGPGSASEAASMLGVTLKKAPTSTATTPAAPSPSSSDGPSFLTGVVNPDERAGTTPGGVSTAGGPSAVAPDAVTPDAVAPASAGGIAGPAGGFRGELAEKLARRRQMVQQQLEDDFDAPDLAATPDEEVVEETTSSELKLDLEDELRSAFSKIKG